MLEAEEISGCCCNWTQTSVYEFCNATAVELVQRQAGFWHLVCGHPKWIQISGWGPCQGTCREQVGIQSQEATTHFSAFSILVTLKTKRGLVISSSEPTCEFLLKKPVRTSCQHLVIYDLRRGLHAAHGAWEDSAFPSWALWKCLSSPPPRLFPGVSQCYAPATSCKCHSSDTQVRLQVPGANSHESCS